MDKETLSNYGWIVICVLVLAVMIALATPFGTFVADAVKSTAQGLFDVNQNALNSTGLINIDGQEFESCAHEYEVTGTTANCTTAGTTTYTCKLCGKSYSEETPAGHKVTNGTCENCGIALKTMTLDGINYYYEDNMTWGEWVNSQYNPGVLQFFTTLYTYDGVPYGPSRTLFNTPKDKQVVHQYSDGSYFVPSESTIINDYSWMLRDTPDNYTIYDPCPHKYEEVSTTATCTETGITTYACKYCKDSYNKETPANHKSSTNGICDACGANTCILIFDGVSYYYEYDMTWGEWLESEYNTDGYAFVKTKKGIYTYNLLMNPNKDKLVAKMNADGSYNLPSESTKITNSHKLYNSAELGFIVAE